VTISSPQRRVDVALPAGVPLAELLSELLRHAGVGLADDGEQHGGWLLRRPDGTALSPATGLVNQGVRDGAVLHLVPAREQWPELEYDDVVEAIADGARRYGLGWSPRVTRATALAAAGLGLGVAFAALLRGGSVSACLAVAAVLVLGGAAASRAYGDAVVGAALAAYGLPFAFAGGLLLGGGGWRPESLLVASAGLLLASVLGALGVAHALRLFTAGATAGVLGGLGALLGMITRPAGAAAVLLAVLVAGVAAVPLLAIRLGKLPMPTLSLPGNLPETSRGLDAVPDRARVFDAVARTDELLTGMLLGIALATGGAALVLAGSGDVSGGPLVAVAAAAFLLRARLFVTVRQRLPLLGAGLAAFGLLAAGLLRAGDATTGTVIGVVTAAVALVVAVAGTRYATQPPSPYLGRAADVLDALCVVSVVPLACAVLGLFGLARGIAG
jgi:type VII secretion integral membrane protein EccD